ncbi:hypothetical protein PP175_05405 [Aneurinibacillus sp. Ricciae_BoGa-3]|uniref:hypothetical protein n=1 Tax=Aneurinibacillus sp. Ricciae_BoGa-3 TaxID=3022697 RepID=UPI002340FE61|nr:hypothetical protein [Aneurinibacillus sp. Ricciae_BoGa-3]WCK55389.1 hypothetical protein PP175_05405 [Aneurinibacillus sp. Ricciae_BoGa-3]
MAEIPVGLTQFLDFTLKGSGAAKTNFVRKIKYQPDYHPAFDHWRQLRNEIKKIHENNLDIATLDNLLNIVDQKKKKGYQEAIKQYKKFVKGKEIEWFDIGKSHWTFENLLVRSTPEIGLIIDGKPHLIKLYFKGKNERIDTHNIKSTLTLMSHSNNSTNPPENSCHAVLNVQRNRLYPNQEVNQDLLFALESEAAQLIYLWGRV